MMVKEWPWVLSISQPAINHTLSVCCSIHYHVTPILVLSVKSSTKKELSRHKWRIQSITDISICKSSWEPKNHRTMSGSCWGITICEVPTQTLSLLTMFCQIIICCNLLYKVCLGICWCKPGLKTPNNVCVWRLVPKNLVSQLALLVINIPCSPMLVIEACWCTNFHRGHNSKPLHACQSGRGWQTLDLLNQTQPNLMQFPVQKLFNSTQRLFSGVRVHLCAGSHKCTALSGTALHAGLLSICTAPCCRWCRQVQAVWI